jgi:uncharacterized damage-inducible protein DinB
MVQIQQQFVPGRNAMVTIQKPKPGEYAPYAIMYIDLVDEKKSVLTQLEENLKSTIELIQSCSEEQLSTPCAEGEWTIKEILTHIMDNERVFAYRTLRFARNDFTELPGYEQDDYIADVDVNARPMGSFLKEYTAIRQASIALFENLPEDVDTRQGICGGNPLSVRAAAWIMIGHETHHINSIRENYCRA